MKLKHRGKNQLFCNLPFFLAITLEPSSSSSCVFLLKALQTKQSLSGAVGTREEACNYVVLTSSLWHPLTFHRHNFGSNHLENNPIYLDSSFTIGSDIAKILYILSCCTKLNLCQLPLLNKTLMVILQLIPVQVSQEVLLYITRHCTDISTYLHHISLFNVLHCSECTKSPLLPCMHYTAMCMSALLCIFTNFQELGTRSRYHHS